MNRGLIFLIIGVLVVLGLFFVFLPKASKISTKTNSSQAKTFNLVIKDKKITSGEEKIEVTEGDEVTINITSDVSEEFHLHGYDKAVDLEKDKTVTLKFTANLTGSFPFELEQSKTDLGSVEVNPK